MRGNSRAVIVRARIVRLGDAFSRTHRLTLRAGPCEPATQARPGSCQHGRICAVPRVVVSLSWRAIAIGGDSIADRRGNRVPLFARRRTGRMANDGKTQPHSVRWRTRDLPDRCGAMRDAAALRCDGADEIPSNGVSGAIRCKVAGDRHASFARCTGLRAGLFRQTWERLGTKMVPPTGIESVRARFQANLFPETLDLPCMETR
jgi:hypothetical protein